MHARLPERPKGADCKSVGIAFVGSNPSSGTVKSLREFSRGDFLFVGAVGGDVGQGFGVGARVRGLWIKRGQGLELEVSHSSMSYSLMVPLELIDK